MRQDAVMSYGILVRSIVDFLAKGSRLAFCLCAAWNVAAEQPPPYSLMDSLEWMVRNSDLVVLGYPRAVEPDTSPNDESTFEEKVTIQVTRVLYGAYAPRTLSFSWKTDRHRSMKSEVELARDPNVVYDRPQLFFLRRSPEKNIAGDGIAWTLHASVFLNQSSSGVATAAPGLATTAGEILKAVTGESASYAVAESPLPSSTATETFSRTKTSLQGCLDCIAPMGAVILRLSRTQLVVAPAYPRFQTTAFELCRSADYEQRERGAYMLRSYPGPASREVLVRLLNDSGAVRFNTSPDKTCTAYVVRTAAYDVLRDQGVVVPKPILEDCQHLNVQR
jgi:hypothetical protein